VRAAHSTAALRTLAGKLRARVSSGASAAAVPTLVAVHFEFPVADLDNMPGYPTPEEAALSSFEPVSKPCVVSVDPAQDADHIVVLVDTEPSHPMSCFCQRRADGNWVFVGEAG